MGTLIKKLFRLCGFDIRKTPQFVPHEWVKGMNIRTILDIGANVGQFASQFHQLLPDAAIYSFEPLKDCYEELLKRMSRVPNFRAFQFAMGDENGEIKIYRNKFSPSSSILPMEDLHKNVFAFTKNATLESIEIRRLDDIAEELDIKENILIKIDVQGFEDKVILGGEKLISKASILIVETSFYPLYKGQPLFDKIYEMLQMRGFVYMGSEDPTKNPRDGSILQCDSIFCRRKT